MDYKKLYFSLFNAITEAIESPEVRQSPVLRELLIAAQQRSEELYMDMDEEPQV